MYKEFSGINWINALNNALKFWKSDLADTEMIDFLKFCGKCQEGEVYYILYNDKKGLNEQNENKRRLGKYFSTDR